MNVSDEALANAPGGGLARRGIDAALWNYLGNAARAGSQFVVAVVLARLLGPGAFGTVAVGWLIVGLGAMFGELGFGAAIVQRPAITRRDVDFAFTMQLATSILITLAVAAAAPWLARFFGQPDAANVVRVMAASLIVRTFGQMPSVLLQRELRYRATQILSVASYTIGFGAIGIALAWLGFGAWSLVGAQFGQTLAYSIGVLALTRRPPALAMRPTHPDIARTGLMVIAANASSWCIGNVDNVIVGHVAGPVMLGLYTRATALATAPASIIVSGLQGVLLSAASRVQTDRAKLRTAFFGSVALFVLLAGAALATMALIADTVVIVLFGAAWARAIPLLPPLSLAMLLNGMLAFAGPMLTATGNVRKEAQAQWLLLPVMTIAILGAAQVSVTAAAWAVVGCYALRLAALYWKVHEGLAFEWGETGRALLPPLGIAAAAAAAARSADMILPLASPFVRLAADIGVAGMAFGVGLVILRAHLARGPLGEVLRASAILPPALRGLLLP